jgi:hypothetical protein
VEVRCDLFLGREADYGGAEGVGAEDFAVWRGIDMLVVVRGRWDVGVECGRARGVYEVRTAEDDGDDEEGAGEVTPEGDEPM